MQNIRRLLPGLLAGCTFGLPLLAQSQTTNVVQVNPHFVLVSDFEGWGTSLCWWANVVGGYANRATYASLAFSTLKLNIVRYNIGGGENPDIPKTMEYRARMEGFEPTNRVWNWNADVNQRWMLKQAVALGANKVVAFANSPPWWMTVSGSVTGSVGGTGNNLQAGYETNFADYLATVVSNLTVLDGVHFDLVTPMNEPVADWWSYGGRQEGCHMDADQQLQVVNDLHAALAAKNLTAGIDASEDNDEQDTINSVNYYGSVQSCVSLIASHSYGANNPTGLRNLSAALRTPAWISEYGDGDGSGMTMARRIHDDITEAWARAWVYWQVVDNAGGWGLLYNPLDASGNTAFSINKKFYVMGQFSEFVRPGCQIINASDNNSLAAYNASNQTLVIVAVNDSTNNLSINYDLSAFASWPTQAAVTRTSPTENLTPAGLVAVTNGMLPTTLVANSVTTYVLNQVAPPAAAEALQAWYPLEGDVTDLSGQGHDGSISNTRFIPGKLGALAAQFNGSNSYVQIPLVISNSFTISFWLKTTDTGGGPQWWAGKGLVDGEVQGTMDDFGVSLVGGSVALGIGNPDTTIVATNAVNDGQWHHVAATRDATDGQVNLYLDGILQASGIGPVGTKAAPPALRIGSVQAGYAGNFLNGAVDDVQLFDRVFGPAEIPSLMNHPPVLEDVVTNFTILAGRTLILTNVATDPDQPAQRLSWSLVSPPVGAVVNPDNGVVSWRSLIKDSPGTNFLEVQVADNGSPVMSRTQVLRVVVLRPQTPKLAVATSVDGHFSLLISGDSGPDYVVQIATNLDDPSPWIPVFTNSAAAMPFEYVDPQDMHEQMKCYRAVLQP